MRQIIALTQRGGIVNAVSALELYCYSFCYDGNKDSSLIKDALILMKAPMTYRKNVLPKYGKQKEITVLLIGRPFVRFYAGLSGILNICPPSHRTFIRPSFSSLATNYS